MSDLTVAEFQEHFETDLVSDALQRFIDDAEADIVRRFGSASAQIDDLPGGHGMLFLRKRASSITTLIETVGATATTLAADDYRIRKSGWALERRSDGTNGRTSWGDVVVTYVPVSESAQIARVTIDLVKLAIQNDALTQSRDGDHFEIAKSYQSERSNILSSLNAGVRVFA